MPVKFQIDFDKRFAKKAQAKYERHTFDVGVLENKAYRRPRPKSKGLGSMEGGPVRKKGPFVSGTVEDVSERVRKIADIYRAPFHKEKSKDLKEFSKAFFGFIAGDVPRSKVESTLRAVIRNPILRGAYGRNRRSTARAKGFNRFLIDTGQLFRAIIAKVRSGRV